MQSLKKARGLLTAAVLTASLLLTGCGGGGEEQAAAKTTSVKAMKVLRQDTPINYKFPGHFQGLDEVQIHPRVTGSVMEKYCKGGEIVHAGQPLFRLDSRQYETAVLEARAQLQQAQSALRKDQEDLRRNELLWKDKAISEQTLTNKRADVDGQLAAVETQAAAVQKAQENLDDTIVYAPMDGQLAVDDVAVGTFATAGSTKLVTIGTINPIYVEFSVSEAEYLRILAKARAAGTIDDPNWQPPKVKVTLSDGTEYPLEGQVTMADRAMSEQSGSITVKATMPNPKGLLLPGMFAQVRILGVTAKGALLVPQRAVQQLLDENFVLVVGEDGKSVSKKVKLGEKVGSYYIVTDGLKDSDTVIVEGLTHLQSGTPLNVTMVTPDEMGLSLKESAEIVDKS